MATTKKTTARTTEELLDEALVPEEEQPYPLPEKWVWVRLGAINRYITKTVDPLKHKDNYYELYSVPSFSEDQPEIVIGKSIGSSKQKVNIGDVLLCKINPRINRVWVVGDYSKYYKIASSEWIIIRDNHLSESSYLQLMLSSPFFRNLITTDVSGVGGSLTRAKPKKVMFYPIPLPPLPEQGRITERLESLLGKIARVRELLEEARTGFDTRRAAILHKAFTGELTRAWREERQAAGEELQTAEELLKEIWDEKRADAKKNNGKRGKKAKVPESFEEFLAEARVPEEDQPYPLPEGWEWVRLGSVIKTIEYGTSKKCTYDKTDNPVLRIPNVINGGINTEDLKYGEFNNDEIEKYKLNSDDILIIRSNGSIDLVGKTAIFKKNEKFLFAGYLLRIRVISIINCDYVNSMFSSNLLRKQIVEKAKSTSGVNNINATEISSLNICLPPKKEQVEIFNKINSLYDYSDKIQNTYEIDTKMKELENSILARAFRGELSTGRDEDEPALDMLKRELGKRTST